MARPSAPAVWPLALGVALAAVAWMRWGRRVRSRQRNVVRVPEPPPTPEPSGEAPVQREQDGTGPRFHRTYRVDIDGADHSAERLMATVAADIQAFCPPELARFEKVKGAARELAVGDEFEIELSAPWDAPVRVAEVSPRHFVLVTLDGHMEAGHIRFGAEPLAGEPGGLRFTIESWARSRDAWVDLAYDRLGVAKAAQQAMWAFFCKRVAEESGGEMRGDVEVLTEREAR